MVKNGFSINEIYFCTSGDTKSGPCPRTMLTIAVGMNCVVVYYTLNKCEVLPYSDDYELVKDVPVVYAETGYTSVNDRSYIVIMNEELYMPNLKHSLINPNQLRHYQTISEFVYFGFYDWIVFKQDVDLGEVIIG